MSRRFTVTVDGRLVFDKVRRGIAKTTIGLYRALADARPDWRFVLFYRDGVNDNPFADLPNVEPRQVDIRGDRFGFWEKVRLPAGNVLERADVFHAPAGLPPRAVLTRLVTTVHDLIPVDTIGNYADAAGWFARVKRGARAARAVITASEHAKGRIVDLCGVPADKVEVVRWGPITAPAAQPTAQPTADELARVRATYGVPPGLGYVLHYGLADPRKNTARVLAAWSAVPGDVRAGFVLVVVGLPGPELGPFAEQIRQLGIGDSVRVHGYVPEADAVVLLAGAAALCYPTLYEGFGLPVLDGFAAGVPVLAAAATSLPEVAGDAAEWVDPTDPLSIAAGLTGLLADPGRRAELVVRGRARLELFDWRTTAGQVAGVFERAAGVRGRRCGSR